jgi:endo-1,4-beta-xylanase
MLDVGTRGGSMFLRVRDGLGAERARRIDLGVPEQRITLVFQDAQGRGVTVLDAGGRVIRTVDVSSLAGVSLPAGLFPDRRFQLGGATEQQGASLTIRDLSLQMVPTGVAPRWPALRDLGERRGIAIGALLDWWRLADERYFEAATREFSLVELAEFSLPAVWLAPGRYDLQLLDNLVDWSLRMGWQVAANHLVFGADDAIPAWLLEGTYTREDYIRILEEHVRTIASRYSGKVTYWHIANEAVSRSLGGGDFWAKKIGPDYIEMAFRWARAADPSGLLIFLDDENNSPRDARTTRIVDTMYNLVKDLKARGVPIDGVGMQNHLFLPWNSQVVPKKGDVVATMQRFASLGVFVYSAELDVVASALGADSELRLAAQASVYGDMAAACVESGVCKAFGTWGITDAHSWVTCMDPVPWCPMKLPTGDPLLFDREYRPKPAYWAVWRAFGGQ